MQMKITIAQNIKNPKKSKKNTYKSPFQITQTKTKLKCCTINTGRLSLCRVFASTMKRKARGMNQKKIIYGTSQNDFNDIKTK